MMVGSYTPWLGGIMQCPCGANTEDSPDKVLVSICVDGSTHRASRDGSLCNCRRPLELSPPIVTPAASILVVGL
jgi:hypothetical protein